MEIKTCIIDAFTDKPFTGNPAGVCLLNKKISEEVMQAIANELNLSETAFLSQNSEQQYAIRYFTPTIEIDFCGHATLASAKFILEKFNNSDVEFVTQNDLKVHAKSQGKNIVIKFPIYESIDYHPSDELFEAFGIERPIASRYCKNLDMVIIEVKDKESLLSISPDYQKALHSSTTIKEVVITTKSEDKEYDFYSRCFCPWIGINEDPVTGASHSVLAKYWGDKLGKKKMLAYQLSDRGGFLDLELLDQSTLQVCSNAKIVFEGKITI